MQRLHTLLPQYVTRRNSDVRSSDAVSVYVFEARSVLVDVAPSIHPDADACLGPIFKPPSIIENTSEWLGQNLYTYWVASDG